MEQLRALRVNETYVFPPSERRAVILASNQITIELMRAGSDWRFGIRRVRSPSGRFMYEFRRTR